MRAALAILFNQDFSRNIPKLERIYAGRFSEIAYLVPNHHSATDRLYRKAPAGLALAADRAVARARRLAGRRNPFSLPPDDAARFRGRIWRVCGHQFYFYHFLCQRARELLALDADWIWVLGDDALLNPRIDERSAASFFGLGSGDDAVLCKPVIGSDAWIERIAGSVPAAERAISASLPAPPRLDGIEPEAGASKNTRIPVACADFFGLRKSRLAAFLEAARACFREKLYVEVAVPNILLSACGNARFVERFDWRRIAPGEWRPLAEELRASPDCAFAHPVKFSQVPEEDVDSLAVPK